MLLLLALLSPMPSLACDVLGYRNAQLSQVGDVVQNEVHSTASGAPRIAGRLVGNLIQKIDGAGSYAVVGRVTGSAVYELAPGNQFNLVGKIDGDRILAFSGGAYTQAGAAVSCLPVQAAAGALLLVLRPVN